MPVPTIPSLTLIGETLNDSVPSTRKLYEAGDTAALQTIAKTQDEGGADYIDLNVGQRSPEFMAEMVRLIQAVTSKPLSIDTPDPALAEAALKAYNLDRAHGRIPILNSISPLRTEMFQLKKILPFRPILLVTERNENGIGQPNHTPEQTYQTACQLLQTARQHGFPDQDCIIDPGISPIAADSDGQFRRLITSMRMIHNDPQFAHTHISVGLSNFTVMLPPKRADGSPTKAPLESAFLTMAIPLGLDHIIGSVKRNYQLLPPDHPAMQCLSDCLNLEGFDVIIRVQQFYS